jgi:biopolymer transport protein ExbB
VFNWTEIWQHMGPPALAVAGTLLIMGVVSLTVFVERLLTLRRSRAASEQFARAIGDQVSPSTVERVVAEAGKHGAGHLARLVESGLTAYRQALTTPDGPALTAAEFTRRDLERRIDELVVDLKRGLPILASVGSVAPFVGLLGTVLGIISAFQGIAATGSGGLSSVSAGIAEALIETALGLAVAIPAVLGFNYLATSIARDEITLANAAGRLADRLEAWGEASPGVVSG